MAKNTVLKNTASNNTISKNTASNNMTLMHKKSDFQTDSKGGNNSLFDRDGDDKMSDNDSLDADSLEEEIIGDPVLSLGLIEGNEMYGEFKKFYGEINTGRIF